MASALAGATERRAVAPVEILNATGGLPAHIVNTFEDPIGFAEATTGESIVLDRRAHTVYAINRQKTAVRKVIVVGFEEGKVLRPGVLALSKDDIFAVADAPNGLERIQYFSLTGHPARRVLSADARGAAPRRRTVDPERCRLDVLHRQDVPREPAGDRRAVLRTRQRAAR